MRSFFLATAITLIASALADDGSFDGIGQLRTRLQEGDHADIGCLTETGLWTGNDEKCGVFVATSAGDALFNLTSIVGDCYVHGAAFRCDGGEAAYQFGEWPKDWPNGVPGVPVLRWGLYGLMASEERTAPGIADAPQEVHLTSYSEPGKRFWLTWKPVE